MLSGRRLDLLDPSPLDIEIEDIAHGLARVARWNGQTHGDHIYSVAQHSLLVERIAAAAAETSAEWSLIFLLHDAPEYVVGDIIAPLKVFLGADYKAVEDRILAAIHVRFALPAVASPLARKLTKQADRAAAFLEATRLAGFSYREAEKIFGRPIATPPDLDALLEPLAAPQAESAFLRRFRELEGKRSRAQRARS
jgi:hypothetical protein